jgi:hypothetical protein
VVDLDDAAAGDDEFALSGFPEFVRSGGGFCGDASRELDAEELTDFGVTRGCCGAEESRELIV